MPVQQFVGGWEKCSHSGRVHTALPLPSTSQSDSAQDETACDKEVLNAVAFATRYGMHICIYLGQKYATIFHDSNKIRVHSRPFLSKILEL